MFTSQDNSSCVTSHQFPIQNTTNLTFSQFNRTQRNISEYNPFPEYIDQIQSNQTVANQTKRSNDQRLMLNTKTTTVPTLSRPPLAPLIIADTYSLGSTNNNPFQSNTHLNVTANPCQTIYQPHTAHNLPKDHPTILPSSFSTVNPMKLSSVNTQNYTLPFVALNISVKTFDGLDHQYTTEDYLHQIDAQTIFTMEEQPLDLVAYNQWNNRQRVGISTFFFFWERFKLVCATSWKFEKWLVGLCICFWKPFFFQIKLNTTHKFRLRFWPNRKLKMSVIMLWKFNIWLKRTGVMNLLQLLTSSVKKFSLEDYQRTERICS